MVGVALVAWVVAFTIPFFLIWHPSSCSGPWRGVPTERFTTEDCQQNILYGLSSRPAPAGVEPPPGVPAEVGAFYFYAVPDRAVLRRALVELEDLIGGERFRQLRGRPGRGADEAPSGTVTVAFSSRIVDSFRLGEAGSEAAKEGFFDDLAQGELLAVPWAPTDVVVIVYAPDDGELEALGAGVEGAFQAGQPRVRRSGRRGLQARRSVLRVLCRRGQPTLVRGHRRPDRGGVTRTGAVCVFVGREAGSEDLDAGRSRPYRFEPLALGEFVLGQVDESNDVRPLPAPTDFFCGGSFLAIRQFAIPRTIDECLPDREPEQVDTIATKMVGRLRGRYPLRRGRGGRAGQRFHLWCRSPWRRVSGGGSHPAIVTLRALGFDGLLANRHRMICRGTPDEDDGLGLMFVAVKLDSRTSSTSSSRSG